MNGQLAVVVFLCSAWQASGFVPMANSSPQKSSSVDVRMVSQTEQLFEPTHRDSHYGSNAAQYLVDLHDSKATFDFCGGMMFQLVLSDMLREHLLKIASDSSLSEKQPQIFDSSKNRMHRLPSYEKSANADNIQVFHGREIRKVPWAQGGMGFVLQLSLANGNDPQGWTEAELADYDGWGHDSSRTWRGGKRQEQEGFKGFLSRFGPNSFGLHHRFYLHYDGTNRMWLSAEDGCEGTPAQSSILKSLSNMLGLGM